MISHHKLEQQREYFVNKKLVSFGYGTRNSSLSNHQMTGLSDRRDEAVKKCLAERTELINEPGRFKSLDPKRERLLELT